MLCKITYDSESIYYQSLREYEFVSIKQNKKHCVMYLKIFLYNKS